MDDERSAYCLELSEDSRIRYEEKIANCGGVDPYTIKEKELSTDRKDLPEITLWDIGNYLIYSMSAFSRKMLKAYKSSEGYSFFQSGFVLSVGSKRIGDSAIVKGKVKHSQRMNKESLQVWFFAKLDGDIICGHCTCTAGLSETCSHVAAVCFAIENIMKSPPNTSATDILCKWNIHKFKEVSMSKAKEIKWTPKNCEEREPVVPKLETSFHSYYSKLPHLSDEVVLNFLNNLHAEGHETAIRTIIYPDEVCRATKIKDDVFLSTLYCESYKRKTRQELIEIGLSNPLKISGEDSKEMGRVTLPRLHSKIWVALRRGRITGSNIKECCSANIANPPITIVNRLINPVNLFGNVPSIKYQKKNKKQAIKECVLSTQPRKFQILESGESFDILTNKPNNILKKIDENYFLEEDHYYFYKTQMQIHLSDSDYCDFVIWSPKETLILRINADHEFWNKMWKTALEFHQQVVLPELLGKFFTRQNDPKQTVPDEDNYFQVIELEIEPVFLADE